jgi:hypothetical protein
MADWLGILLIFILAIVVLFVLRQAFVGCSATAAEGFGDLQDEQSTFGDIQNTYFHDKINKGIFSNPGLNLVGLNEAAAQPDLDLAGSPAADMTRFFVEDPENAFTDEDNKMCRGAAHPRDLPARAPGERLGCGWYFQENPDKMSTGALGTRERPVIPTGLAGGQWIWNRARAIMLEDLKQCKKLKNCTMLSFGDTFKGCGFCFEKRHGIPIDANGAPKYPDRPDGVCGSKIITKAEDCFPPAPLPPDGAPPMAAKIDAAAAGADPCVNNGIVTIDCVLWFISLPGFDTLKGGLARLIVGKAMDPMTTSALDKLRENGISIPEAIWKTRDLQSVVGSLGVLGRIADRARRIDSTDFSKAARFMVDGSPYTPCESYTADQRGPFDMQCLRQAFRKTGCQAGGAAYPSTGTAGQRAAVSELASLSWAEVNSRFKKTYDDMKSTDPRTQDMALKNCLGVGSEFARDRGATCWKCEGGIHVPLRRNAAGDIECASTNGLNCLWQASKADCDMTIAQLPADLKPLACGADHKAKYGGDGYSTPAHWCAKAEASGAHNGPMAKDEKYVIVYQACDYGGNSVKLGVGRYALADLIARGVKNDDISSIKSFNGATATLYEHNFSGQWLKTSENVSCFTNWGFNDKMSSIIVE